MNSSESTVLAPAYGLLHVLAGLLEPIEIYFRGVKNLQLIYYRTSIYQTLVVSGVSNYGRFKTPKNLSPDWVVRLVV